MVNLWGIKRYSQLIDVLLSGVMEGISVIFLSESRPSTTVSYQSASSWATTYALYMNACRVSYQTVLEL